MAVEERFATTLHDAWRAGRRSLRLPLVVDADVSSLNSATGG
jgi:hypothetical protein